MQGKIEKVGWVQGKCQEAGSVTAAAVVTHSLKGGASHQSGSQHLAPHCKILPPSDVCYKDIDHTAYTGKSSCDWLGQKSGKLLETWQVHQDNDRAGVCNIS